MVQSEMVVLLAVALISMPCMDTLAISTTSLPSTANSGEAIRPSFISPSPWMKSAPEKAESMIW